jgi:hypothetical protein
MDVLEVGWGMDWIDLAQDRDRQRVLVNAVILFRVTYGNNLLKKKQKILLQAVYNYGSLECDAV